MRKVVRTLSLRKTLPKSERLKSVDGFNAIFRARRLYTDTMVCYYKVSPEFSARKFAVSVSKKVSKLAVKRNRFKRIIRECYRLNKSILPENVRLIIRALPEISSKCSHEIDDEIKVAFNKICTSKYRDRVD